MIFVVSIIIEYFCHLPPIIYSHTVLLKSFSIDMIFINVICIIHFRVKSHVPFNQFNFFFLFHLKFCHFSFSFHKDSPPQASSPELSFSSICLTQSPPSNQRLSIFVSIFRLNHHHQVVYPIRLSSKEA